MSWLASRSEAALARVRELWRRYNRYFLLRHLGMWHTSLHWIAPVSMIVCLVIAALVLLPPPVAVRPVDQFVYPFVLGSVVILLLWLHAQSGALIPFRAPVRRRILRLLILRLVCVAAVFLPPVVLGVTMHERIDDVAGKKRNGDMQTSLSRDRLQCFASLGLTVTASDCKDVPPGIPETPRDVGCGLLRLQISEQILAENEGNGPTSSEYEELQKWIGAYCKELEAPVRAAKKRKNAVSTEKKCKAPESPITPVAEPFWKALATTAPKTLRVYMVTHYTFPRQLPRSLMYLLACVCVTFPFLGVWVGYGAILLVIALWWIMLFGLSFVGAMNWLSGQGPVFDTAAIGVIALCGLALVAWPIARSERVPPRLCLLVLASALIAGPFLPISVLRLGCDWGDSMPAPMLDDPALPSLIILEFWPGGHPQFGEWEWQIYAAGLAYCCIFLMVVGPIMQRISASPK